jgi:hypothetical protein
MPVLRAELKGDSVDPGPELCTRDAETPHVWAARGRTGDPSIPVFRIEPA